MKRFYDWVLQGSEHWPRVLVPFKQVDDETGINVQTVAGWFEVSPQLLGDLGFIPGFRRWPSMDEAMMMDMNRWCDDFEKHLADEFPDILLGMGDVIDEA